MKKQLEARLEALKSEFESGKNVLADLDKKSREVETTLMRISGAIQVIEELLDNEKTDAGVAAAGDGATGA